MLKYTQRESGSDFTARAVVVQPRVLPPTVSRTTAVWVFLLLAASLLFGPPAAAQTAMLDPAAETVRSWERDAKWTLTEDFDGRFRALLPGRPVHHTDTLETAVGQQVFHTHFFKVPEVTRAENVIYVVSYVDYPPGSLHHDSLDLVREVLLSTETSAAEALRGEVVYGTKRAQGPYPGRLWRINYRDGEATARTLAFVIGHRYYELKTFALSASGLNDSTERFFGSFEYLGG